jgi:hypothetical protein
MYELQFFNTLEGIGFKVLRDGSITNIQEYDPDLPGEVPMSLDRASAAGLILLRRLQPE